MGGKRTQFFYTHWQNQPLDKSKKCGIFFWHNFDPSLIKVKYIHDQAQPEIFSL